MTAASKPKGRRHGAAMMVWMFFANLFDPKSVVAAEQIETHKRVGADVFRADRTVAAPPEPRP